MDQKQEIPACSLKRFEEGPWLKNPEIILVEDVGFSEAKAKNLPYRLPRPTFGKEVDFDIPAQSIVSLVMKQNPCMYEGKVFKNPKHDGNKRVLKLVETYRIESDTRKKNPTYPITKRVLSFQLDDIEDIYILSRPPIISMPVKETSLKTFTVRTRTQFDSIIHGIETMPYPIGVKIFGESEGRFTDLYWLILCTKNTLIPIDFKQPELQLVEIWQILKSKIFENGNVLKLFHNMRQEADFLYHNSPLGSPIEIVNGFDTQIGSYLIDLRSNAFLIQQMKEKQESIGLKPPKIIPLSASLRRFLPHIIWDKELNILQNFESSDASFVDKLVTRRPIPACITLKYMSLTVKYLEPLKNVIELSLTRKLKISMDSAIELMKQTSASYAHNYLNTDTCPEELREKLVKFASSICLNPKDVEIIKQKSRSSNTEQ